MRDGRAACVLLASCTAAWLCAVHDTTAQWFEKPLAERSVYVPGIEPNTHRIRHYPVKSRSLVLDPYRNPRVRVTINSFSDFLAFPRTANLTDFHFVPIGNSGYGMTLTCGSCLTAADVNAVIRSVVWQLPDDVRSITFYQRKDVGTDRFPLYNVYTGPMRNTHPRPHQVFFRHV